MTTVLDNIEVPEVGRITHVRQRLYLVEETVLPKSKRDSTLVKLATGDSIMMKTRILLTITVSIVQLLAGCSVEPTESQPGQLSGCDQSTADNDGFKHNVCILLQAAHLFEPGRY